MQPLQTSSESELCARLREADPLALEQLYDRYSGYAMAVAYKILGTREEAEEVVQDVFWRLWASRIEYDPKRGRFKTWLFGICRNRAIDALRSRARRPRADLHVVADDLGDAPRSEEQLIEKERGARVRAALSGLPAAQRTAIELSFYRGLTHREISDETGEPVGTIKSRIHGGMTKLRGTLANIGGGS